MKCSNALMFRNLGIIVFTTVLKQSSWAGGTMEWPFEDSAMILGDHPIG